MTGNPHDALFKATFSQVEHAAGELRHVLPRSLLTHIDLSTLALKPGSFVDEALGERFTDLLFTVALAGKEAFVYVLLEHQSSPEPPMAFRLLRYMVRIWEAYLKERPHARSLPFIVPVVLHHSEAGWTAETTFEGLYDVEAQVLAEAGEHALRFRFLLDDLSMASDEALRGRAMSALGRLALWCLRTARTPEELLRGIGGWLDLVREVRRAANGPAALATLWRYILAANRQMRAQEVLSRLLRAVAEDEKDREEIVNAAEELIEEGRREGLVKGQRQLLFRQLRTRFGELPEAIVARIEAAGTDELERWAERILVAQNLEAVVDQ